MNFLQTSQSDFENGCRHLQIGIKKRKYYRAGMSNWRPAGLCSFCAARIGIFIMQQFNYLAYFLNFYLSLYEKPNFEY